MFKKITAFVIVALLIASLAAVQAFAGAMNPADGCKTEVTLKKAAAGAVVHDGFISEGEYEEIEINRDSDTTDMLLSWDGSGNMLLMACDFLQNVHFYASWDENGVNFAGQSTLLEEPYCEGSTPVGTDDVPQDEHFMFQFGFMTKFENPEDDEHEYLYYSIGKNTVTGELLGGHYGRIGFVPYYPVAGQDYNVRIDGNTVTYEISFPFSAVFPADQLNGGIPAEGAKFSYSQTMTGGSLGVNHSANATYAVSLGDGGFMTSTRVIGNPSGAWATISNETIVNDAGDNPGSDNPGNDNPGTDNPVTDNPGADQPGTNENPGTAENPGTNGNTGTNGNGGTNNNPGAGGKTAPKTGDPMIVIAAIAAVSAAGAVITKKKRF
ncbi:MAG: hypothetical protein IJS78_07315 [Clostridia bacterium]|nr:hypothetical protein [Clostridia bacterium]